MSVHARCPSPCAEVVVRLVFYQSHEAAYLNAFEKRQVLCYVCHHRSQWNTAPFVIIPQKYRCWPFSLILALTYDAPMEHDRRRMDTCKEVLVKLGAM